VGWGWGGARRDARGQRAGSGARMRAETRRAGPGLLRRPVSGGGGCGAPRRGPRAHRAGRVCWRAPRPRATSPHLAKEVLELGADVGLDGAAGGLGGHALGSGDRLHAQRGPGTWARNGGACDYDRGETEGWACATRKVAGPRVAARRREEVARAPVSRRSTPRHAVMPVAGGHCALKSRPTTPGASIGRVLPPGGWGCHRQPPLPVITARKPGDRILGHRCHPRGCIARSTSPTAGVLPHLPRLRSEGVPSTPLRDALNVGATPGLAEESMLFAALSIGD
jgi:hypothetical protein